MRDVAGFGIAVAAGVVAIILVQNLFPGGVEALRLKKKPAAATKA
jgi:hypothetical protein